MRIVIMGCGRVGARLALMLDREGHQVAVIDLNVEALNRLEADFHGTTIVGTGIDEDVLKSAGIEQADAFLALTSSDNPNIMAAQIASHIFKVPRVITRIYDPAREDTFHEIGLETICPTTIVAARIHQAILNKSAAPLDDGEEEPLPGEMLARTHTTTMPLTGTTPSRPVALPAPPPESPAVPQRREPNNPNWRKRLFR